MKLRNNYNVGDRILILHANTKNQLRKNDIGKIGTILDKRCSFCVVHLDGDDRDKNYNYGTFAKITKVIYSPISGAKPKEFENEEACWEYLNDLYPNSVPLRLEDYKKDSPLEGIKYNKKMQAWESRAYTNDSGYLMGYIAFKVNNELNNKFPDETNNIQERGEE